MRAPRRNLLRAVAAVALTGPFLAAGFLGGSFTPPAAGEEPSAPRTVKDMDLGLLEENMLKIWIVEESSDRYNQMRIAQQSFEALAPIVPTGDAEIDRQNVEARIELDKSIEHYLKLELDGAIQVTDICRRVLGTHAKHDPAAAGRRRFLGQNAPDIDWRGIKLEQALQDLGRKLKIRIELTEMPESIVAEIDLQMEGATVQQLLSYITSIHPMTWEYEEGLLRFKYVGESSSGRR